LIADAGEVAITDNDLLQQLGRGRRRHAPTLGSDGSAWDLQGFVEDAGNRNHIGVDPEARQLHLGLG
jgi:hypothetical protein